MGCMTFRKVYYKKALAFRNSGRNPPYSKRSHNNSCIMKTANGVCLVLLIFVISFSTSLEAQPSEGLEMFNPTWSMFINDYGYSDFAFDQRPGSEGREYLSGEWAAAITYVLNSNRVAPRWLNPDFIFPDWVSDSDFGIESPVKVLNTNNTYGFTILQSVITNGSLRIKITSEFVDTTNGVPEGLSPRSAVSGSNNLSDRYVLHQTFSITNKSGQTLTSIKFFKFLHALEASTALYDDRTYGPAYHGHHYTIMERSPIVDPLPGEVVYDDIVCLHANIAPTAWEVGRYGIEGVDDHGTGKPSVGTHLSVEADALSNLDLFAPTEKWVSGAVRCDLGALVPNASTNIEFLMSLHSVTKANGPFGMSENLSLIGWGDNSRGQTNVPSGLTNAQAISAGGSHNMALLTDRSVVAWGDNAHGQTNVPSGLSGVQSISAGGNHSLAMLFGGAVRAWGDNSRGQTNAPPGLAHVLGISAGSNHCLALLPDGSVAAWGDNSHGQTNVPPGLAYVMSATAGGNHSLALLFDGSVIAWGDNSRGQTDVPSGLDIVQAISAGGNHSVALLWDGSVVAWGDNSRGQTNVPPGLNDVISVAAGGNHSLALLSDGSVVAWGDNSHGQTNAPNGLTKVTAISAGGSHSLAIKQSFAPPRLAITKSGTNAILSFPAPTSQFTPTVPVTLEERSALRGSNWIQNEAPAVIEDGFYKVKVPIIPTNRFYRLHGTIP